MDGNLIVQPAPELLVQLLGNLSADANTTNTRFYRFTRFGCFMFFNSTVPHGHDGNNVPMNDQHWHSSIEHGIVFHKDGGVVAAVTVDYKVHPIENGQYFSINLKTAHSITAREGTVFINWHDGLAMPFPAETLLRE